MYRMLDSLSSRNSSLSSFISTGCGLNTSSISPLPESPPVSQSSAKLLLSIPDPPPDSFSEDSGAGGGTTRGLLTFGPMLLLCWVLGLVLAAESAVGVGVEGVEEVLLLVMAVPEEVVVAEDGFNDGATAAGPGSATEEAVEVRAKLPMPVLMPISSAPFTLGFCRLWLCNLIPSSIEETKEAWLWFLLSLAMTLSWCCSYSSLLGYIFAIRASKLGSGLRERFETSFLRQVGHSLLPERRAVIIHSCYVKKIGVTIVIKIIKHFIEYTYFLKDKV